MHTLTQLPHGEQNRDMKLPAPLAGLSAGIAGQWFNFLEVG